MVDGVLASCYADVPYDLGHIGMAPMRWFPEVMNLLFGQDNESPGYVHVATELGKWFLPSSF